jgi:hypothetical protein
LSNYAADVSCPAWLYILGPQHRRLGDDRVPGGQCRGCAAPAIDIRPEIEPDGLVGRLASRPLSGGSSRVRLDRRGAPGDNLPDSGRVP